MKYATALLLIIFLGTTGCALIPARKTAAPAPKATSLDYDEAYDNAAPQTKDPLYIVNKAAFVFNDKLLTYVIKPITDVYRFIMPQMARTGIRNFFHNVTTPVRFANCLLQGKGHAAEAEFGGFIINTTIGVLGFGRPTQNDPRFQIDDEDLGQTLGRYGIGDGCYLVLPFFGPSSLRDAIGDVGDSFLDPVGYLKPAYAAMGARGLSAINKSSFYIDDYTSLKEAALDPYDAFRDAYLQHRQRLISK